MSPSHLLMPAVVALCVCVSCHDIPKHPPAFKEALDSPTDKKDSVVLNNDSAIAKLDSIKAWKQRHLTNRPTIWGHRYKIRGDFDGDGRKETLIEHYYSGITHKETNKFYEWATDEGEDIDSAGRKETYAFMQSDNPRITRLDIDCCGTSFGLLYLKNEGDLDGDHADEISFVIDHADWSTLNTWIIMTYKNKQWQRLYSFPIWEWQTNDEFDSATHKYTPFPGLVKKLATNKIQITYRTDDAEMADTIIDLRHPNKW